MCKPEISHSNPSRFRWTHEWRGESDFLPLIKSSFPFCVTFHTRCRFPTMLRREMQMGGRKWFSTTAAVEQTLIMLTFCVIYGCSHWSKPTRAELDNACVCVCVWPLCQTCPLWLCLCNISWLLTVPSLWVCSFALLEFVPLEVNNATSFVGRYCLIRAVCALKDIQMVALTPTVSTQHV